MSRDMRQGCDVAVSDAPSTAVRPRAARPTVVNELRDIGAAHALARTCRCPSETTTVPGAPNWRLEIVRRILAIATGVLALTPVAAWAAQGPVRGAKSVDVRYHVTFTLPGNGWRQVTGAMAGTPDL